MDETKIRAIKGLVILAVLWLLPTAGRAATITVDCSSASLQAAIEKARPGDALLVSGTCKENLIIYEEAARITLDGQGKAMISGPDGGKPTIAVRGRGITIKGFTVSGGSSGIVVAYGGQAVIDGNTVQGAGWGILLIHSSSAEITDNTVQNNRNAGIGLGETSSARIRNNTVRNNRLHGIVITTTSAVWVGVSGFSDQAPSPNIIENNEQNGILVTLSSSARIVGNTIRNNKQNGIAVARTSSAFISSNTIDANAGNGINVTDNAQVSFASGLGTKIFRAPNSTGSNNGGVGIRCAGNSSVDGQLGSLNGSKGAKNIDPSCVVSLKP